MYLDARIVHTHSRLSLKKIIKSLIKELIAVLRYCVFARRFLCVWVFLFYIYSQIHTPNNQRA